MLDTSYNNSFELQLQEAGYKWFQDNFKGSLRGFQKRITDEKGIKYFINGYHWNFGKTYDLEDKRNQYSFDVQFIMNKYNKEESTEDNLIYDKGQCIDIHYSADFLENPYRPVTSLKEVEEFYEKMWITINPDYYEIY